MAMNNHLMPDFFNSCLNSWFSQSKYQMTFSSMRGPMKQAWSIGGGEVNWVSIVGMDPNYTISILTHHETLKLLVCADKGYIKVPCKDLCKEIEKAMCQL